VFLPAGALRLGTAALRSPSVDFFNLERLRSVNNTGWKT
jgi:hypothetical protein